MHLNETGRPFFTKIHIICGNKKQPIFYTILRGVNLLKFLNFLLSRFSFTHFLTFFARAICASSSTTRSRAASRTRGCTDLSKNSWSTLRHAISVLWQKPPQDHRHHPKIFFPLYDLSQRGKRQTLCDVRGDLCTCGQSQEGFLFESVLLCLLRCHVQGFMSKN